MAANQTAIYIDEHGCEKPRRLSRCEDEFHSGNAEFLGRRRGVPIFKAKTEVYWWNGSDVRGLFDERGPAMHRPGECRS